MKKIVTLGEIMLRLAPEGYLRFVQSESFGATFGGGEANVAVSLANFGYNASFVTKLPSHEIGQMAVNSLRKYGVDTSEILRGGNRIGIYFLEKGASQRPSKVVYDRAGSSFAESRAEEYDWDKIFGGADLFYITGITPALGANVAELTLKACEAAKKHNVRVACDLNYRSKLWSREEAQRVMTGLMPYVDICIANDGAAKDVFGITAEGTESDDIEVRCRADREVAKQLKDRFGFPVVALTIRTSLSSSDHNWGAMIYDGENCCFSRQYSMHLVDRVGGGDSFGAGLVYGLLEEKTLQETIDFAVAASCLKHSIEGDCNLVSVAEVEALAKGSSNGRIQR